MIIQIFDYSTASVLKNYGTEFHRPYTDSEKRNKKKQKRDQERKANKDECKNSLAAYWFKTVVNSIKKEVKRSVSTKIICAELHRQSLLDNEIFAADQAFGELLYKQDYYAVKGYHLWAKPVVKLMRKSKIATRIVHFIAKPWTEEMAFRMNARQQGNIVGKTMMIIGMPFCRVIGIIVYKHGIKILWLLIALVIVLISIKKKIFWRRSIE